MDKEYLEDYEQKEASEYQKLLKSIEKDEFDLKRDRFPPDRRFMNIRRPVALTTFGTMDYDNIWAQIPFCGSLILTLPPYGLTQFEKHVMKTDQIPKIIEYVKETGKLQVALSASPLDYEGLDYLDPFFKELKPPFVSAFMLTDFAEEKEIRKAKAAYERLGNLRYFAHVREKLKNHPPRSLDSLIKTQFGTYAALKLGDYPIIDEIESLMINNPEKAIYVLSLCSFFLIEPIIDLRSDQRNFSFDIIRDADHELGIYKPEKYFPCEIGKFLVSELTHQPQGPEACRKLMDDYDSYDLQKVLKSLNEGILLNRTDLIEKGSEELSVILKNIWDDKTIPNRIDCLKIGLPVSMAAIGYAAAGLQGAAGAGFLAEFGLKVGEKAFEELFSVKGETLLEKVGKFRTKSYQATVYDFKKKYQGRIKSA